MATRIVAAAGSRPVFVPEGDASVADGPFLQTSADLHLEGLEVRWPMGAAGVRSMARLAAASVVTVRDAELTLVGCRVTTTGRSSCLGGRAGSMALADSHLQSPSGPCVVWDASGGSLVATNCVFESDRIGIMLDGQTSGERRVPVDVKLRRCSLAAPCGFRLSVRRPMQLVQFDVRESALDVSEVLRMVGGGRVGNRMSSLDRRRMLSNILDWKESRNIYRLSARYLSRSAPRSDLDPEAIAESYAEWRRLWGIEQGASYESAFVPRVGEAPFAGGPFAGLRVADVQAKFPVGARLDEVGPAAE